MATITIRMSDEKYARLKALAKHRRISVNKLIEEFSTQALAEFDSEVRFRALAASGDPSRGLALLDKLDAHFSESRPE
ncbi:MAG: toxin-antitoxin system HicB family antitoxin [Chloroflexi bacterium]|nr:MAG: toxin-antitoxin system HicB family antitoxin [Chloroflexota bacterium]